MLTVMELDAALDVHLDAIRRRDLDAFAATLHPDVCVVLPNGRLIAGAGDVVAMHREWFADTGWSWELALELRHTVGDTAVVLFVVTYHDVTAAGDPHERRYRLSLVFVRQDGGWLLLHDQNTDC